MVDAPIAVGDQDGGGDVVVELVEEIVRFLERLQT
jgi:hypothetical protein